MENSFYPTPVKNRIEVLDVLRGFAMFGVLLSNILIFSGFNLTPFSTLEQMHLEELNKGIFVFLATFVIGKAYPIFCMLFGIGFYMQYQKYKDSDKAFHAFFARRVFLLFLIGLLHAVIWPGDVMHYYALFGLLLIPLKKLKPTYILVISVVLLSGTIAVDYHNEMKHKKEPAPSEERIATLQFDGVEPTQLIQKVQHEGLSGMYFFNAQQYKLLYSFDRLKSAILRMFGFFLLGIFLFAKGLITEKMYSAKYLIVFFILGAIGRLLSLYISFNLRIFEQVFLSLFFITLIGMLLKWSFAKGMLNYLKAVGKMAMTNYVMQSVLAIITFYGVGFALFAKLPLYGIFSISILFILLQTLLSNLWLRKHQFGPLEYVWRTLTYKMIIRNRS